MQFQDIMDEFGCYRLVPGTFVMIPGYCVGHSRICWLHSRICCVNSRIFRNDYEISMEIPLYIL